VPSTLTVAPPSVSTPETSMARIPPVVPFHQPAVSVEPRVALEYWGMRTTWKRRCPRVVVAAAFE
jgi:hypothetical protein